MASVVPMKITTESPLCHGSRLAGTFRQEHVHPPQRCRVADFEPDFTVVNASMAKMITGKTGAEFFDFYCL